MGFCATSIGRARARPAGWGSAFEPRYSIVGLFLGGGSGGHLGALTGGQGGTGRARVRMERTGEAGQETDEFPLLEMGGPRVGKIHGAVHTKRDFDPHAGLAPC